MLELFELIGVTASLIGISLFLVCIWIIKNILDLLPNAKIREDWQIIVGFIVLLLLGYIINIWALLTANIPILTSMQSFVYVFGAFFSLIVINLSYKTYKLIIASAEEQ
ncbi:MAG: hypothetical protein ACTSYO_05205 [Candidatus Ranarchaeia archaeon]